MEFEGKNKLCVQDKRQQDSQTMPENRNRTALNDVTVDTIVKHLNVFVESSLIRTKQTRCCTQISMRNQLDVLDSFQTLNTHIPIKKYIPF